MINEVKIAVRPHAVMYGYLLVPAELEGSSVDNYIRENWSKISFGEPEYSVFGKAFTIEDVTKKLFTVEFNGTTNAPDGEQPWINTITVAMPDGREFVIDRDHTDFSVEDGKLSMSWLYPYIWDGEGKHYDLPFGIEKAELVSVDIEVDAPAGYEVHINEMWFD